MHETMDFEAFKAKYFRFWNVDDLPTDVTFDKYQKAYFREKRFDVDVTDGQLNLEFQGENWACCVSAVVIFPVQKAAQGEAFLKYVEARRRFYFDNYFKRVLPCSHRRPAPADRRGPAPGLRRLPARPRCRTFLTTTPPGSRRSGDLLRGEAFAGEYEPVTVALVPLRDLGDGHRDRRRPDRSRRERSPPPRSTSVTSRTASAGSPRMGPSTRSLLA